MLHEREWGSFPTLYEEEMNTDEVLWFSKSKAKSETFIKVHVNHQSCQIRGSISCLGKVQFSYVTKAVSAKMGGRHYHTR